MTQKSLSRWLKAVFLGIGICGLVLYFSVLPVMGLNIVAYEDGYYAQCFWPWLIFLWASAVPCYMVLVQCWKIARNIGKDLSFSMENAKAFRTIAWFAAGDSLFFFLGNIVLLFVNCSHPGIALGSMLVVFAGVAVSIAAAGLSHLVQKAASLQEQSDLTI